MRRGQDRHDVGAKVLEIMFPAEAPVLWGIELGTALAEVEERLGEVESRERGLHFAWPIDDPFENGRIVHLRAHARLGRAAILTGFFTSADRLDVDAAYRFVRKHLKACHGRPGKEVTGVLKFVYAIQGHGPAARTTVCRYRNDQGQNVLEVSTRQGEEDDRP